MMDITFDESEDLNTPPAQNSPNHILNTLNDFCIQHVFQHLTILSDFLNASEVCTRFQNNAKSCFPLIFKEVCIFDGSKKYLTGVYGVDKVLSLKQQLVLLKNFGHSIYSIRYGTIQDDRALGTQTNCNLFNSIVKFCGRSLIKLAVNDNDDIPMPVRCRAFLTFDIPNQFPALKVLELTNITVENLHINSSLEELKLRFLTVLRLLHLYYMNDMHSPAVIPTRSYPKLLNFEYSLDTDLFHNYGRKVDKILKILKRNPQIVDLRLFGLDISLKDINDRVPDLEVLHCSRIEGKLNGSEKFETLKQIYINDEISDEEMVYLSTVMPNIEDFRIKSSALLSVNGITKTLKSAKNLTRLWLCDIKLTCRDYRTIMSTNRRRNKPCIVELPEDALDNSTHNLYDLLYIRANHPNLNVIKNWWARENHDTRHVWANLDIEFLESANFH